MRLAIVRYRFGWLVSTPPAAILAHLQFGFVEDLSRVTNHLAAVAT